MICGSFLKVAAMGPQLVAPAACSSAITGACRPRTRWRAAAGLGPRRAKGLEPILRRLETGSFKGAPEEPRAAGWTGASTGRAFIPYASAGAPAVDHARALDRGMATGAASVGGVGWHDAEVNREQQECE